MFQEGYMAYLQGWDSRRIALYIIDLVESHQYPECADDDITDFLDGHAAAAKENSNAI